MMTCWPRAVLPSASALLRALASAVLCGVLVATVAAIDVPPERLRKIDFARCREKLASDGVAIRTNGLRELGRAKHPDDRLPAALAASTMIGDANEQVRQAALTAIASALETRPVTAADLAEDAPRQAEVQQMLDRVIAAALGDDDHVRYHAMEALGRFHVEAARGALRKAFADPRESVCTTAVRGMVVSGTEHFVDLLLEGLSDERINVQEHAINALYNGELTKTDAGRTTVQPGVDVLMRILQAPAHPNRGLAARSLGQIGEVRAVPELVRMLEANVHAQLTASALSRLNTKEAAAALLAGMKSPHADVRAGCANNIGGLSEEYDERVDALLVPLLADENVVVLRAAVGTVWRRKIPAAVPGLIALARRRLSAEEERSRLHPMRDIQRLAARTLGDIGDRRAVEPLGNLLKSPAWEIRFTATEALGKLDDKRAIGPLRSVLDDPQSQIRDAAGEALWSLGIRDVGWQPAPPAPSADEPMH